MKRFNKTIAIILCLIMAISSMSMAFGEEVKDYSGHWAEATIQKWIDEGKISGYPDGSFKPDGSIKRAEFVKMVNGIIDYDGKGTIAFEDVKTDDWFYDQVRIAQEIGYISGYSPSKFAPNDNITREQAAAILARIQYLKDNSTAANKFTDNSSISSWAVGAVGAASNSGFINGNSDGSFNPQANLSRAEAVTMLENVLVNAKNYIVYKDKTELTDIEILGDLIIAKTVGDGDVYLKNVDVKGHLYVYGGGLNSVYFNNVKVARIEVEKDKVRLVFDDGTKVEEIALGTEAKLENINGEIGKVSINSEGKITLSGKFDDVEVVSKSDIELSNATVANLVVNEPIKILGTGTIATLTANANGIQYESTAKITKTVVGEKVTEKPAVIKEETSTGGSGGGYVPPVTKYSVSATAELKKSDLSISKITYTTSYYTPETDSYDVVKSELISLKDKLVKGDFDDELKLSKLQEEFAKVESKEELWNRMISKLANTAILSGVEVLKDDLLNDVITKEEDILPLFDLYTTTYNTSEKAYDDLDEVIKTINASDLSTDFATYEVIYKSYVYETKDNIENLIKDTILKDITDKASDNKLTVSELKDILGSKIIIKAVRGQYTSTLTIQINELTN